MNPRSAHALWVHGVLLAMTGPQEEAVNQTRRSIELDPLNPFWNAGLVQSLVAARDWDGAIRQARATLDLAPEYWFALCFGGQAHVALGRLDDAIDMFERGVKSSEGSGYMVGLLGHALARAGRVDEARRQLDRLHDRGHSRYVAPLGLALVHAGLDQRDDAFASLSRAIDVHDAWVSLFIAISPALDGLRPDPRFAELRRSIGL